MSDIIFDYDSETTRPDVIAKGLSKEIEIKKVKRTYTLNSMLFNISIDSSNFDEDNG
jgi:hypothetical protein